MRRTIVLGTLALAISIIAPRRAAAEVPAVLPIHGFLTDAQGVPIDTPVMLRLALYTNDTALAPLFEESHAVTVDQGYFFVRMGTVRPLDIAMFRNGASMVIGLSVDGDAEMTPRLPLGVTPFAAVAKYAEEADTLGGLEPSDFRLVSQPIDWSNIVNVPDDTLASLPCTTGQVPQWSGTAWTCLTPSESDPLFSASAASGISASDIAAWDAAETDPLFSAAPAAGITASQIGNWNDAYGWGDHAAEGYALSSSLAPVATSGSYTDLTNRPAYTAGDRLIFAQDAEIAYTENPTAWTKMNETSAVQSGQVRLGFEAFIGSGPDYWAWKVTINGSDVTSGAFSMSLYPGDTPSVHQYRRYQIDLSGVSPGARVAVWMKASDAAGGGFGTGADQVLYMKRFRVYNGAPMREGGVYTAATWRGRLANAATLIAANAGFALLTSMENGNPDVFEVVTTGTYGVRFLRAGHIMWAYDQDIISGSAGSYPWMRGQVGQDPSAYTLIRPTSGLWDGLHNSGVAQVAPGDVLIFEFGCSGCDITAMDEISWSTVSIFWMGHLDP